MLREALSSSLRARSDKICLNVKSQVGGEILFIVTRQDIIHWVETIHATIVILLVVKLFWSLKNYLWIKAETTNPISHGYWSKKISLAQQFADYVTLYTRKNG